MHKMVMRSLKVKKAGLKIGDDISASLMPAGLPDDYRPMVVAMENSSTDLTTDYVQNRLLQEVSHEKSTNNKSSEALDSSIMRYRLCV